MATPGVWLGYGRSAVDDALTRECVRCREEFEELQDDYHTLHRVDGEWVCRECIEMCGECGEWLDDSVAEPVKVQVRRWETGGRLDGFHAGCAAQYLLSLWSGDRHFDYERATREQIGDVVAAQTLAVVL